MVAEEDVVKVDQVAEFGEELVELLLLFSDSEDEYLLAMMGMFSCPQMERMVQCRPSRAWMVGSMSPAKELNEETYHSSMLSIEVSIESPQWG